MLKDNLPLRGNIVILAPFIDNQGLLRVGGRLQRANLAYEKKHQVLLPKHHHITDIIIREIHLRALHAGVPTTVTILKEEFWIVDVKNYVKNVVHKCVICRRAKLVIPDYLMGNLPRNRVNFARPFLHSGVDFFGSLYIKEKRLRNCGKLKIYVAVFVCFSTRAVHLELVEDLTSDAFYAALKRFFSRRGKAAIMYSDNATNFVGVKHHLDKTNEIGSIRHLEKKLSNKLAIESVKWQFIPPRSPHFGGLWEAAVKAVKRHMIRIVKNTLLSYEALLTLVVEIEAILNSRPLTPLSADPNDLNVLTPAHFLIGDSLTSPPECDETSFPTKLSNWKQVQLMRQHFWTRWQKEYLHTLTVRKKWHLKQSSSVKIGDLVLLKEENLPPLSWSMARIISTHPGEDGIVRVVTVKTSKGVYERSVKGIAPLPIDE